MNDNLKNRWWWQLLIGALTATAIAWWMLAVDKAFAQEAVGTNAGTAAERSSGGHHID